MREITLQVVDIRALPVTEGEEHAVLAMVTANQVPFAGPDGSVAMVATADDVYKVPLNKQALGEVIESLQEAYENLPDPKPVSNLFVPESMGQAEQIAANLRKFR